MKPEVRKILDAGSVVRLTEASICKFADGAVDDSIINHSTYSDIHDKDNILIMNTDMFNECKSESYMNGGNSVIAGIAVGWILTTLYNYNVFGIQDKTKEVKKKIVEKLKKKKK